MKKSALLIIIGLIVFISFIPLVMFYEGGFFLTCFFGFILFISGISMIIYGIIVLVKGMNSKKDQLEFETDEIQVSAFLEPFFWIKDATVRIFRNRRRSSAMLSGIILSTLVISSVFIYTGVMQQDLYDDIVKLIPYEASFTLNDQGNESTLWDITESIKDDDRVESYTVFGGISLLGDGGYDWRTESYYNLEITFSIENGSNPDDIGRFEESIAVPIFVRQSFSQTTIFEKMFGDNLEGSFDLDLSTNATVMPRTRANKMNLDVGDTIDILNISIYSFSFSNDRLSESKNFEQGTETIQLRNVKVVGIYSDDNEEGSDSSFFFNTGIIEKYSPSFMIEMERYNLFTLAVKINPSEFSVNNMNTMSNQINRFVSDVSRDSEDKVSGQNNIAEVIGFLSFIRIFIIILDFIMILPTVILSLYFLVFGLDLSLEERKREIAILKVQGGNSKQIYRMVAMESVILFVVGLAFGYFLSMVAAWIISSSIGFMTFDISWSYLYDFFGYHKGALITASIVVGFIVLISIVVKAKKFIRLEVAEGVQQLEEKKKGFFRRTHLDLVLFAFGAISALKKILDVVFDFNSIGNFSLSLGEEWDAFVFGFLGTITLWIGGAMSGPTIAKWISLKSEKLFLKLFFLKDVALIIKSGLKRRGDAAKLVLIIILTLSVATLAAVQGFTDQINSERNLEYEIGADYKVIMSKNGDHVQSLKNIIGIEDAMPITIVNVEIFSTSVTIYGIDAENAMFMAWHDDSFDDITPKSALSEMDKKSEQNGVFLGSNIADELGAGKGDRLDLKIQRDNPLPFGDRYSLLNVLVLGTFDHAPPEIGSGSIICDHSTILRIRDLQNGNNVLQPDLNSTIYLLNKENGADPDSIRKELDRTEYVINVRDLDKEIEDISDQLNFGIPGLLTMMFIVSIICVFTSAFAFSSIIIKRRMREFAVLQTVGATRWQIYKIAIGENALVMFVSVVLGLLVGLGLSYQMNGFFGLIGEMLGRGSLERVVFIPWFVILIISAAIFIGMILAVAVSAVNAARQDLAVSTRVV